MTEQKSGIIFNTNDENEFKEITYEQLDLLQPFRLDPDIEWKNAMIDYRNKFLGAIGKQKDEKDALYIWNLEKPNEPPSIFIDDKIFQFDFDRTGLFVVIFKKKIQTFHLPKCSLVKTIRKFYLDLDDEVLETTFSLGGKCYAVITKKKLLLIDIGISEEGIISEKDIEIEKAFIQGKFLFCYKTKEGIIEIYDYLNDIKNWKLLHKITITEFVDFKNLLATGLDETKTFFIIYFMNKKGIYKVHIKKNGKKEEHYNPKEIVIFRRNPGETNEFEKGIISLQNDLLLVTDYQNIYVYNTQGELTDNFSKQKFKFIFYDFNLKKMIYIDDVKISITNYPPIEPKDENDEKIDNSANRPINIYTNENFNEMFYYRFSNDGAVLLTMADENNVAIWDCKTGGLIGKWYGNYPMWYKTVCMSSDESEYTIFTTKVSENLIQVWNYVEGTELMSLVGFNCYSIVLSNDGTFVVAGAVKGKEIARCWNLEDEDEGKYASFLYIEESKNVTVHLLKNSQLICTGESEGRGKETPTLVYDFKNGNLLYRIEESFLFISKIESTRNSKWFYILGNTEHDIDYLRLYKLDENNKAKERISDYSRCSYGSFSKNNSYLLISHHNKKVKVFNLLKKSPMEIDIAYNEIEDTYFLNFYDEKDPYTEYIYSYFHVDSEYVFVLTKIISESKTGKVIGHIRYSPKKTEEKPLYAFILQPNDKNLALKRFGFK